MFEFLSRFDKVLVTGPQRSATHICARMIEHDTGFRYVDEDQFEIHNRNLWQAIVMKSALPIVVQCPSMSRYIHELKLGDGAAIVWMIRPVEEICASEARIGWDGEAAELEKYGTTRGPISQVKYDYFERVQRPVVASRLFEIGYDGLAEHPLWIPKDGRRGWGWTQTEEAKAYG